MATLTFFPSFKESQLDGNLTNTPIDFDSDTIKVALCDATYTPASSGPYWQNTSTGVTDPKTNEVSGTNYVADGDTLATASVNEAGGTVTVDYSVDPSWSQHASGFTNARYAVIYKFVSAANDVSPLIGYIDFTSDKGNQTGDLTLQFNASGLFTLSG